MTYRSWPLVFVAVLAAPVAAQANVDTLRAHATHAIERGFVRNGPLGAFRAARAHMPRTLRRLRSATWDFYKLPVAGAPNGTVYAAIRITPAGAGYATAVVADRARVLTRGIQDRGVDESAGRWSWRHVGTR